MKIKNSKLFIYILIEIPIIILFAKAYFINTIFINQEKTFFYRFFQTISHDLIIYFIILLITYLSYQIFIKYFLGVLLRLIALSIFIIYLIDIYILNQFASHLILNDIIKYLSYAPNYINQMYELSFFSLIFIFFGIVISLYFLFKNIKVEDATTHFSFIITLCLFIVLNSFSQDGRYIHSWLYKNFLEYNYEIYDQSKEYSDNLIKNINNKDNVVCSNKKDEKPNIIILMVESLASYQSNYFSGIKDWTPNLDKIAQENINFTNFYANGFVTEDAEIAMITGDFPIYAPNAFSNGGGVSFDGFYNIPYSLPNILKQQDYNSEFITSSDLNFSNTGEWAKSNGFTYTEGSEHHYYKDKKRYHFDAAADEYLYNRVMHRIDSQNSKYFIFIKTVTSHAPFKNPEDDSSSEEGTIRYVDKQIGNFYKELQEKDFFKNGILIIVGDHHPVIPIRDEEIKRFGHYKSSSATPAVVVYKNRQKTITKDFQQTDIYNSLKNLVSSKKCISDWHGDFISSNTIHNSKYIIHRRGDKRGIISIFSKDEDFNIKLNGDDTKIIESNKNKQVLTKINYTRIQRDNLKYKYIEDAN